MNHIELNPYLEIIKVCLKESGTKINKLCDKFMFEVLLLYLIIPRWINSLQLSRVIADSLNVLSIGFFLILRWFNPTLGLVLPSHAVRATSVNRVVYFWSTSSQAVRESPSVGWRFLASVSLIWIYTPVYIWKLFRLMEQLR